MALPVEASWTTRAVARILVGDDVGLYAELLECEYLSAYRLAPLEATPGRTWLAMATLARDAGVREDQVSSAALRSVNSWSGSESEPWEVLREAFESLETSAESDPRINRMLKNGAANAYELECEAKKRDHIRVVFPD